VMEGALRADGAIEEAGGLVGRPWAAAAAAAAATTTAVYQGRQGSGLVTRQGKAKATRRWAGAQGAGRGARGEGRGRKSVREGERKRSE